MKSSITGKNWAVTVERDEECRRRLSKKGNRDENNQSVYDVKESTVQIPTMVSRTKRSRVLDSFPSGSVLHARTDIMRIAVIRGVLTKRTVAGRTP